MAHTDCMADDEVQAAENRAHMV